MKHLSPVLLVLSLTCIALSQNDYDSSKKLYQTRALIPDIVASTHPALKEVTLPETLTPAELKQKHKDEFEQKRTERLWNRGFLFLSIGLPLFFAGFFMSTVLAQYGLQMIAHFLSPTGLTLACTGAFMMKLAELWVIVTAGVLCLTIYGIVSYLLRDRGYFKHEHQKATSE